jgi:hypothetical protein
VAVRATLDHDITPRNTWNVEALAQSLTEIRHLQQQGVTVLCGHDDAQWQSLDKGANAYD